MRPHGDHKERTPTWTFPQDSSEIQHIWSALLILNVLFILLWFRAVYPLVQILQNSEQWIAGQRPAKYSVVDHQFPRHQNIVCARVAKQNTQIYFFGQKSKSWIRCSGNLHGSGILVEGSHSKKWSLRLLLLHSGVFCTVIDPKIKSPVLARHKKSFGERRNLNPWVGHNDSPSRGGKESILFCSVLQSAGCDVVL